MIENKNLLLAVVLSLAIVLGYEAFVLSSYEEPVAISQPDGSETTIAQTDPDLPSASDVATEGGLTGPSVSTEDGGLTGQITRAEAVAKGPRIQIETPRLRGSISLVGARLDDIELLDYRVENTDESANIPYLNPRDMETAYYTTFGWVPGAGVSGIKLPDNGSVWQSDRSVLSPGAPVTLTWDNGEGLLFTTRIAVDDDYLFTIYQEVENNAASSLSLHPYGLITRRTTPETTGFYILHEGLIGVFAETLSEVDYDDIQDEGVMQNPTTGGWLGITDKYWLAAMIPDQTETVNTRFVHRLDNGVDKYQADFLAPARTVPVGGKASAESLLFLGAKQAKLLDAYAEQHGIDRFDLAIDFGWFYFLTKPIFYALLWLNDHVGNLGVAILILTVGIKLAFFPLANKSYVAMSKMKALQPQLVELRERYKEDKAKLNQEMMALYKREKANPAAGCLPILVQIPVFFALYKVLFVTIEMRHAPFFGWIQDLSAPDPTTIFNLFGLFPWDPPSLLMIGIWPLLMGGTMYLQQKLNPQPTDPVQAKIFLFMPILFTFLLASFPAGLVIYWAWNNTLSILQQWVIMRRMGVAAS